MTSINVIKKSDAVHMLTDGASWLYNGDYYYGPQISKAWPLPHLSAVVATRGPVGCSPILADLFMTGCSSYDEMKRAATTIIGAALATEQYSYAFSGPFSSHIEFVIAGWSETIGPDAFVVKVNSVRELILENCGQVMMAPGDKSIEAAVLAQLPARVTSAEEMDPVRDGILIMEAQRAELSLEGAPRGMVTCGAFAQLTTVDAQSITSKIIKRWPYKIGHGG
jgi:hypothetical protein